jgi:hypothetical protein
MSWEDILKRRDYRTGSVGFGECEKKLIEDYSKLRDGWKEDEDASTETYEMNIEGFNIVLGKIEDFLAEWDDKYGWNTATGGYDPPGYKDHMTEDYTHHKLEEHRKINNEYFNCKREVHTNIHWEGGN